MDANSLIKGFLGSYSAITNIVSSRIYASRIDEGVDPADGAILIRRIGGETDPVSQYQDVTAQILSFAASERSAGVLYETLRSAINGKHNITVAVGAESGLLYSCIEESLGSDLIEDDYLFGGAPYVSAVYRFRIGF